MKQYNAIKAEVDSWQSFSRHVNDTLELAQLDDESLRAELEAEVSSIETELEKRSFTAMLSGKYDQDSATPPQPYRIYTSGPGAWIEAASIPVPPIDRDPLTGCGGGSPTISGKVAAIESRIYRDSGGNHWEKSGCVYLPEADTERWYGFSDVPSALRGTNLFSTGQEYDYEVLNLGPEDIMGWDIVRVWRPRLSGAVDYFARLNPDYGVIYWSASEDGRRVGEGRHRADPE